MSELPRQFADYYHRLVEVWNVLDKNWTRFSDYQQETIALYFFNSDYGANGLADYVALHGDKMLDVTLRGLRRIGAERLAAIVRRYFDMLNDNGFDAQHDDVNDFLDACLTAVHAEFDQLQVESASLYSDFYGRWEQHFATKGIVKIGKRIMFRGTPVAENWPKLLQDAQSQKTYSIAGEILPRIPYGSESSDWGAAHRKCHDCSAIKGELHVVGCDAEECPRCKGQAFSCDCPFDEK